MYMHIFMLVCVVCCLASDCMCPYSRRIGIDYASDYWAYKKWRFFDLEAQERGMVSKDPPPRRQKPCRKIFETLAAQRLRQEAQEKHATEEGQSIEGERVSPPRKRSKR